MKRVSYQNDEDEMRERRERERDAGRIISFFFLLFITVSLEMGTIVVYSLK